MSFKMRKVLYKLLLCSITITGYAENNFYIMPQINYGVSILENSITPVIMSNIDALYNFNNTPFVAGIRLGYTSGASDTNYTVDPNTQTGINSFTRTVSLPYAGISFGAVFNPNKSFQNMILINIQNSIGASYNVNCQYNTTICQNQTGKQISSFSFGLENNMLFNITQNVLIGINSGILFTNSTFTNYSSLNSTTFADAKTSTATTPYMGLSLNFNF